MKKKTAKKKTAKKKTATKTTAASRRKATTGQFTTSLKAYVALVEKAVRACVESVEALSRRVDALEAAQRPAAPPPTEPPTDAQTPVE